MDRADIEHDLIGHVLKQADKYDPDRAAVNTFIVRVVETAAAMLVRDRGRLKRAGGFETEKPKLPAMWKDSVA